MAHISRLLFLVTMGRIKNGKYELLKIDKTRCFFFFHFIKIIKGPKTSFQSPALCLKHVRKVCYKITNI